MPTRTVYPFAHLDDGSTMRRTVAKTTPGVDRCVRMYKRLLSRMVEDRPRYHLQQALAIRVIALSLGEQKAYYAAVEQYRIAEWRETNAISWR